MTRPHYRVAGLYDIHGNLPALEAVLEDVQAARVDAVVIGGDVFPGPLAVEALDRLLEIDRPVLFLTGNGDRAVRDVLAGRDPAGVPEAVMESVRWVAGQLIEEHRQIVKAWPDTVRLEVRGMGHVLFCHATPRSDTEVFTRHTPVEQLRDIFAEPEVPMVVCGHTHMQFHRLVGTVQVVNAGSVGMPFGRPGAYWLLLDGGVRLRWTEYDLEAAAVRIHASGYPGAAEFADRDVLAPRSEAEMLEMFSQAEMK